MSTTFKDRIGTEWVLDATAVTVERIKASCGIDLYKIHLGTAPGELDLKPLMELAADPQRLLAVVWEMARGTACAKSIDDLKAGWDADTADAAVPAFIDAWINLFPGKERRVTLKQMVDGYANIGREFLAALGNNFESKASAAVEMIHDNPIADLLAVQKADEPAAPKE